ncbi:MAG: DNA-3-methyladenine glycosylase family protein [Acidimicrobiales bacterium]
MTHCRVSLRPSSPVDLRLTLGVLGHGRANPSVRFGPGEMWRATRTPDGPATTRVTAAAGRLTMQAWGPGAACAAEGFPALVGEHDHESGFAPRDAVVADLRRRLRGLRLCRTGAVVEALVPAILEQKVIGLEARRSYAGLVRMRGEPAPGPGAGMGLMVPPEPSVLARTPSYVFHRLGVERKRADTIRLACSYARRLEEVVTMPLPDAYRRLTALPGIGPWTAAEVALVALGDADAVSVGDYHLPNMVAWALAGEARAGDDRMLELLEPYRGHRGRVIRLIEAGAPAPPRFGPRLPLNPIASR